MNGIAKVGNTHPRYKEGNRYLIIKEGKDLSETSVEGVIIERLVSPYVFC